MSPGSQYNRFETLVKPRLSGAYGFALRLTGSPVSAEDLLQQSLVIALTRFGQLREDAAFGAWLNRIVYRTFVDSRRKRKEEPMDPGILDNVYPIRGQDSAPDLALERARMRDRIQRAMDVLPSGQREALWLVDGEGFTFAETAKILDIPVGTAASRVIRARIALRTLLDDVARDQGVM